jgi:asparagine synthase (glutamine-hydrolysing)
MCGLIGWYGRPGDRAADEALASRMIAAIGHRGPDGHGVFVPADAPDGPAVGLGHARLAIVGLADGAQPMHSADGALTVVFNGEIFNWVELRAGLEARGHRFRTGSDTEVLLALYAEEGEHFLSRLDGDFAFALWDHRRRRLLLARDRVGVRPLFYTEAGGRLWFASEVKALLCVPGVTAELDPIALDQIFTTWAPIAPRTAFAGIGQLEPGERMIVDSAGIHRASWWSLDFPDATETARGGSTPALEEELAALLADATRLRMRADVPVGTYLSGGLDSSIVAALAARTTPRRIDSFSVTFDDPDHDESPFQEEMAATLGTRHEAIACRPGDIAADFPAVIAATECPILRTAPAPLHRLSGLVRRHAVKVVLTGEGADEIFAGYDLFREDAVRRFVARRPASRWRALLYRRLYPWSADLARQTPAQLAAFFSAGGDDPDDPLYSHRPRFRSTAAAKLFFSPALADRLDGHDAGADLVARLPERFGRWHPLHRAQYLETRFLLPGYILSSQGDRMAMAHGIEGRFPFLDHRVIEFAARLPPGATLCGLDEKHVLKRAFAGLLPPTVLGRHKQPYRAPNAAAFRGALDGDGPIAAALSPEALAGAGLFEPTRVRRLVDKCRGDHPVSFRDDSAFVGILSTQLWLARFTGPSHRPAPSEDPQRTTR